MPGTITTTETFPKPPYTRTQVEAEIDLRIKAGAIRSRIEEQPDKFLLITEWNVIGQND